ncbi:MAG TPA: tocopherol cyclase family protein [Kofleriaceae bacterium]|nr:tocopherol cyclase family protein [Kofleriaceae bacterium]
MAEADNIRRWDGQQRGHYEVWYLTLNHAASGTGYWIRYTLESPRDGVGEPYAQLWFACFDPRHPSRTFAINRKFPIAEMTAGSDPFAVSIAGSSLRNDGAQGALEGAGHRARWDLRWIPSPSTHRHLPGVMYRRGGLGDTTVLSPNLDVAISGTIEVDGERYELGGDPGGQTHLWGRKHAHEWAWGHCNAFQDHPGSALEALTVRLKRRGRVLPPLTVFCLYLDGREYRFADYRDVPFTRGMFETGRYQFRAASARIRIEGEYTCNPDDMVVATYHDPDGEAAYCANTEIGDLRVTVFERPHPLGRWRETAHLVAPGTGHFEVGGRQRDPRVRRDHVTV